ncbi:MAG: hypothetical protein LBU13_00080 [Synergistaceae bacterium]|jgi:hypothetical protein|nr:hypothetical protein [Synergistaceae bacterium]
MFERVLAHEMTHVLMFTYGGELAKANSAENGGYEWLAEGLAEYVHGANDKVVREHELILTFEKGILKSSRKVDNG